MLTKRAFLFGFPFLMNLFFTERLAAKEPKESWMVFSPDKNIRLTIESHQGALSYYLLLQNDTVVKRSSLGVITDRNDFSTGLTYQSETPKKIDEVYTMLIGKRKENRNEANELTISFLNSTKNKIQLAFRVYNDGIAFRYQFMNVSKPLTVTRELSSFTIPTNGEAWLQSYGWSPAYERWYTFGSRIGEEAKDSSGWSFPALFHSGDRWLLLTEAGLDEHFYASHLQQDCSGGVYKIRQPLEGEVRKMYTVTAYSDQPFSTPWRVVMLGRSLGTIVESNLVYHLSPSNKIGDVSWVKPGKSSWSWWSDHSSSKDYNKLKNFVDLAVKMNWPYSLVDANWDIMQGGTIEDLVKYAHEKNIALSLWYNSGGPHNTVTERPRDIMSDPQRRKAEFKKLHNWGVKAVKVDFFESDKQDIIRLYLDILKDAAAEQIMVIFHGCTIPRGWSRTYPNLLSMEAVHGAEQYGWDTAFGKHSPTLNIVQMCTRNVVGPMDYTPVTFSSYACCPHSTTNAHELALTILFESGMEHLADSDSSYLHQTAETQQFLKSVPNTWDDTRFMDGYPGRLMVLARQKANEWYVGAANGEDVEKTISPDLSFLPEGNHTLSIFLDGRDKNEIAYKQIIYKKGDPLQIKLLPYGGCVIRIQ